MSKLNKIWIYNDDQKKCVLVDRDRLTHSFYEPTGKIRYLMRKGPGCKARWCYVYYAETREELIKKVNECTLKEILLLKQQISKLESSLVD